MAISQNIDEQTGRLIQVDYVPLELTSDSVGHRPGTLLENLELGEALGDEFTLGRFHNRPHAALSIVVEDEELTFHFLKM